MASTRTENITLDESTLLTRKAVCDLFHIGLSTLDSMPSYKDLKRIKIGRHTFFLKSDVEQFIFAHRNGVTK